MGGPEERENSRGEFGNHLWLPTRAVRVDLRVITSVVTGPFERAEGFC